MLEVATRNLGLVTKAQHRKSTVQEEEAQAFLLPEEQPADKKKEEDKEEEEEDMVSCLVQYFTEFVPNILCLFFSWMISEAANPANRAWFFFTHLLFHHRRVLELVCTHDTILMLIFPPSLL